MRGRLTFKTIVNAVAVIEKTQRVNGRSTKVSLLISRRRERGHYAPEPAWIQGFGATLQPEEQLQQNVKSTLFYPTSEQKRTIRAAEAERIRHGIFQFGLARDVGNQVHACGIRVGILQIDRRRQDLVAQSQHGNAGFKSSSAAEQVP